MVTVQCSYQSGMYIRHQNPKMMAEYDHINGHATLDEDTDDEAEVANTPHNSKKAKVGNPRKLLQ